MKRFLYLFQVEEDLPSALEQAAGDDSDILFLSWRARSPDPRSIHYPSSSWTQGRNRLLREAIGRDYLYVVFADDDIVLSLTDLGVAAAGPYANPWRVFEQFLLSREPAVGCGMYSWHLCGGWLDAAQDVQTLRFFDAILNAFHREAVDVLLPYYDLLDEQTECYSQNLLCSLAADLFPGHVIQTNRVRVANTQRRRVDTELLVCKPDHLYLESLRDTVWRRRFARQSIGESARHPTMGPPRAKPASYAIAEDELASHYDLRHALWTRRRELLALPRDDEFYSDHADSPRARRWREVQQRRAQAAALAAPSPVAPRRPIEIAEWTRAMLNRPTVRSSLLFQVAREVYRGRTQSNAMASVWRALQSRRRARALWKSWYRDARCVYEIPESRQQEVLELLAVALNSLPGSGVVFIDVGAGRGDVRHRLVAASLHKRLFSVGIDPIDVRAHLLYAGYVQAAITDGPEGYADFYCYGSSDCSSLKRLNAAKVTHDPSQGGDRLYYSPAPIERLEHTVTVPTFNLSTIVRQYGLADDVLHFLKIDAQGSDLDAFRSLGSLSERCLFVRTETVLAAKDGTVSTLYDGQSSFAEDRAVFEEAGFRLFNVARFDTTPEADVTFVNVQLFRELLPQLCR